MILNFMSGTEPLTCTPQQREVLRRMSLLQRNKGEPYLPTH